MVDAFDMGLTLDAGWRCVPSDDVWRVVGFDELEDLVREGWLPRVDQPVVVVDPTPGAAPDSHYLLHFDDVAAHAPNRLGAAAPSMHAAFATDDRLIHVESLGAARAGGGLGGRRALYDGAALAGLVLEEPAFLHERGGLFGAPNGGFPGLGLDVAARVTSDVVTRTPHIDAPAEPVRPGTEFVVQVYVDQEPFAEGEDGEAATFEFPEDTDSVTLDVALALTEGLEARPPFVAPVVVTKEDDRSSLAEFTITVAPDAVAAPDTGITAFFSHKGRPCGSVHRRLTIAAPEPPARVAPAARAPKAPARGGQIEARLGERQPDLTIEVVRPGNARTRYTCKVTTPHLVQYEHGDARPWKLSADPAQLVRTYMVEFEQEGIDADQRLSALQGAGRLLFEATPPNFQDAYWKLRDAGKLETILVVSSEDVIPWELVVPHRDDADGVDTDDPALGVSCSVGRWISKHHHSPHQLVPLADSCVIAPRQGHYALEHAADEVQRVLAAFHGVDVTPTTFHDVNVALAGSAPSLIHFICHGKDAGGVQRMMLELDRPFSHVALYGAGGARHACREGEPLVFLNACELGRAAPALIGMGGFVSTFVELGARCVIAPLWSVQNDIARDVADRFYTRISGDATAPFADALREIRALTYDPGSASEDTYAAYAFYGDPFAASA